MPIAVTYARYSSDRQHESSIEAQHAAIEAYARQHGIDIVEQYADRAISGKTDARPEFIRLLSDLQTRKVDLVLVHKLDRFARNRYHAAVYSRLIRDRGARLVAVAQDFGSGPEAVIMESLMQGMAEYYSLNLATEVIKGRKVNIAKGRHPGGTYPFGYRPDGAGGYVIDEVEAYYVRRLYQAVIDGTPSCASIVKEMRAVGIKGRRGRYLTPGNVAGMLKKPIYAGIYDQKAGDKRSTIENHHPAIVTQDVYKEALRIMEARQNVGRAPRREYLCTGLVVCSCGKPMYGHTVHKGGRDYVSYVCSASCGNRSIRVDELDRAACDYVRAILRPDVREQLIAALTDYMEAQRRQAKRRAPDTRRQIARLQEQIDALTANMAAAVLPASVLERLGKQITECEAQIEVLRALLTEPPAVDPQLVNDYFADAAEVTPDTDPVLAQKTLRRFIERITVHPTAIEFICTFDAWLRTHFPDLTPPPSPSSPSPHGVGNPEGVESPAPSVSSSPAAPVSNSHTPASRNSSKSRRSPCSATASCPTAAAA